jgi:tetratricopeptide (TPR) repeat protein
VACVEALTGQAQLIAAINRILRSQDRPAIRLRGPSGSGKTWVAQSIVQEWQAAGDVAFVARGDELLTRRPHFPMLLAVASETSREQLKATTKLALEPVTAIPVGGKPLREILFHLFERKDAEAAAKTPYLRQDDREILMRMQKASAGHRALLVCDNVQWWDPASIELLSLSFSPGTRAAFPFLQTLALVAVQTEDSQTREVDALETLFASNPWQSFDLPLCGPTSFGELLRAFGIRSALPPALVERLYAITGGHLELVRRVAEADAQSSNVGAVYPGESMADFLFELLEHRLERHASVPEDTASVLRAAAIIGNSFAEQELDCLLRGQEHLARILEPAEKLRILERSGKVRRFVHDIVRRYYLDHAKTQREALHGRFADCLRLIHCGDYARRTEHLRRSGNRRGAGEMLVLECLRSMRAGRPPILENLRDDLDEDLMSFVVVMFEAQGEFDNGRYAQAIEKLDGIESLYADALLAERDILLARCHIKILSRVNREQARVILSRWERLKDSETEVWGRAMVYLTVACVFLGDEAGAQDAERELYRTLSARVSFDPTARRTVNHVRLKSNMLHSVQVARERLSRAIEFFGGFGDVATYDPEHQYIGLVNLAANHIVEGEFEDAFAICQQANALIQSESSVIFARPDILISNLTLAGHLSGHLSLTDALEMAQSVWHAYGDNNDSPLLGSNVAYYLARQGRYSEVVELVEPIFNDLLNRPSFDSYYTYFVGNNLCGSLFMSGKVSNGEHVWNAITPFVRDFVGPIRPYITKRHEMQGQIFLPDSNSRDWDNFVGAAAGPQVGPGWKFYGRGFLAAELEFWSDE